MTRKKLTLAIACAVLLGGCSDLSEPTRSSAPQPNASAVVAPPSNPNVADPPAPADDQPPTSLAELKAFARECDKLLAELDQAHRTNRLAVSAAKDNGASWGRFARSFRGRIDKLRARSRDFAPTKSKLLVGTIAGDLDSLFSQLLKNDANEYREFRQYVATLIDERDAHLAELADQEPQPREFTDSSGQFRVTADFVSADETTVRLRKLDGSDITVPLKRLSSKDREWISQQSQGVDSSSSDEARQPR